MHRFRVPAISFLKKNTIYALLISVAWILGLISGCLLIEYSSDVFAHIFHSAPYASPSAFSSFFVLIVPFLLSFVFIKFSKPAICLLLIFIKALSFSCCSCGIIIAYASAGWLVRFLLLFADSCITAMLLWFMIRNVAEERGSLFTDTLLSVFFTFLICCFDAFAVSPYLMLLL